MDSRLGAQEASSAASPRDVRILHRVDLPTGPTPDGDDEVAGVGVVVDVGTAGVGHLGAVIELAARRFTFDASYVVTRIDRSYVWRQDPGLSLPDDVVRRTGLSDADLTGRSIELAAATRIIGSADVRIAHNARFDRPLVEELLPDLAGYGWACSIEDVGWTSRGYGSAGLDQVLSTCGYFQEAHHAEANVDATIQILRQELEPGRTALAVLMESAARPSWIVRAFGAAFQRKDVLRERGYHWNALQRVWWREIRDRTEEESWLRERVYHGLERSRVAAQFELIDWTGRYV